MEVVNSEDNGLRSYIGYNGSYIGYISYNGSYICYKGSYICYIGYKGSNGGINNEINWWITNANGWCRSHPFQSSFL